MASIDRALADPLLFGIALGDPSTWATWRVVLKAAFALGLIEAERATFSEIAGGRQPPQDRVRQLWAIAGRRGGKSRMAALISCYWPRASITAPTSRLVRLAMCSPLHRRSGRRRAF